MTPLLRVHDEKRRGQHQAREARDDEHGDPQIVKLPTFADGPRRLHAQTLQEVPPPDCTCAVPDPRFCKPRDGRVYDGPKLNAMHSYAWKRGLKTGMYYLRSKAATDAIKFTVDQTVLAAPKHARDEPKGEEPKEESERSSKKACSLSE